MFAHTQIQPFSFLPTSLDGGWVDLIVITAWFDLGRFSMIPAFFIERMLA